MNAQGQISVRARFERFPATVKGAFIVRGEDPDPHQAIVRRSRVVAVGGRSSHPIPVGDLTLDVAPHQDVFVPFEFPISDLDPGWYDLECDVDVDGVPATFQGGRRFVVAWPRGAVRRGSVPIGREIKVGRGVVRVEQLECAGDSSKLALTVTPPAPLGVRLEASGEPVEVLEFEIDQETGVGRIVAYPLLRAHETLRVEFRGRGRGREAEGAMELELP